MKKTVKKVDSKMKKMPPFLQKIMAKKSKKK